MASAAIEAQPLPIASRMPSSDASAVESGRQSKRTSSLSFRWSRKLFGNTRKTDEHTEHLGHDIVAAAKGGPDVEGAAATAQVQETDPIQHVAGTGVAVDDPLVAVQPETSGKDKTADEKKTGALAQTNGASSREQASTTSDGAGPSIGPSGGSSSSRLEKPAASTSSNALGADEVDPTAGAGALSAATGPTASVENSDDEEERSRAPSIVGHGDANGKGKAIDRTEVDRIEFYRRDQPYFWLSNSSEHPVSFDGTIYPTAEHLFQALKFLPKRPDLARKVRKASAAADAMREARKHMVHVKGGWIQQGKNVDAMRLVLLLKFSQHPRLTRQLLMTGDAQLIEASPTDAFWGAAYGSAISGLGRNELGKALQRTRENLRNQAGLGYGSAAQTV